MTGVEILATQEAVTAFGFSWFAFWFVLIFGTTVFILIGYATDSLNEVQGWLIGLLIGGVFSVVFAIAAGAAFGDPIEYETQYKVIISDEVSMNDFLEHYEIISQEDKIYTVRENNDKK